MKLVRQELVWMLRFNSPAIELLTRKVLEVDRHDQVGTALDRGGEHMTIVGIGQVQNPDQLLEVGYQRVARMRIH